MSSPQVICLDSDDEVDQPECSEKENVFKIKSEVKIETAAAFGQFTTADDEVEVVDASTIQKPAAITASSQLDNDEELEITGVANETLLPHNRQNCLACRFQSTSLGRTSTVSTPSYSDEEREKQRENSKFCNLCYCYVCDKLAGECDDWYLGSRGVCVDVHDEADAGGKENDNHHANGQDNVRDADDNMKMAAKVDAAEVDPQVTATTTVSTSSSSVDAVTSKVDNSSLDLKEQANPASESATAATAAASADTADSNHPTKLSVPDSSTTQDDEPSNPATKSSTLSPAEQLLPHHNHSQATDTGPLKKFWYNMRLAIRQNKDPSQVSITTTQTRAEIEAASMQRYAENYGDALHNAMIQAMGGHAAMGMAAARALAQRNQNVRRRGRSANPPTSNRRRTRPRNSSLGPSDHRQRIRAQNMLESLYSNPESGWN
jgi:hypothetical protein